MIGIDRIIKGLECCTSPTPSVLCKDKVCPYFKYDDDCIGVLMKDAMTLLKSRVQCRDCVKRYTERCPQVRYIDDVAVRGFPPDYWYCGDGERA